MRIADGQCQWSVVSSQSELFESQFRIPKSEIRNRKSAIEVGGLRMFCPKCASQNIDGAKYCRACGANISLVPQALTGQLPPVRDQAFDHLPRHIRRRLSRRPTVENGTGRVITGLGFLAVAVSIGAFAPAGRLWWFWLLIPAFSLLGKGISEIMRAKQSEHSMTRADVDREIPAARLSTLPPSDPGELAPPPSIAEGTTRHLGAEAPTIHFDPAENRERPS